MIKREPAPYLSVIREKYPDGAVAPLAGDVSAAGAFITTATVLGEVTDPSALDLVEAWWLELDAAPSTGAPPVLAPTLERMQHATLSALGARPRDRVVSRILDQLERMDRGKRVDSLQYLMRSSEGNAEVIRRLRAIHDAPASPLHGDRDLANAIARLSGAR